MANGNQYCFMFSWHAIFPLGPDALPFMIGTETIEKRPIFPYKRRIWIRWILNDSNRRQMKRIDESLSPIAAFSIIFEQCVFQFEESFVKQTKSGSWKPLNKLMKDDAKWK